MSAPSPDYASVAGKALPTAEHIALLVVGAGPAGLAAATEAARRGVSVMLVDENPVPFETMGEEVPLHFGQRMGGATRNRNAMTETLLQTNPGLAEAFEAGVDLRLATVVWGLFAKAPTVAWIPAGVAGVADHERSWLVSFDQAIVASGRRDMGLAFPGWELPGVMGATAALRLAASYESLEAKSAVVLGTSVEALQTVRALHQAGVMIAAVVECLGTPLAPAEHAAVLSDLGVPLITRHVVKVAEGGVDGVEAVVLTEVDGDGRHIPGTDKRFACDSVVLGVGAVPSVELFEAVGCKIAFQPERGGHVPVVDQRQRTSIPAIHAIGDCAGLWGSKSVDPDVSRGEALSAVSSVAEALGGASRDVPSTAASPDAPTVELAQYRCAWVRASVIEAEGEPHVCQCEEVTAREILEVRPPRYLSWEKPTQRPADLASLLGEGPPNPDQVKRLTRAGMGPCQGRRCREQTAAILALGSDTPLSDIPLATFRAPVRPLPLSLLAEGAEPREMSAHWDTWFGMAAQWRPFWNVPATYTAAERDLDSPVASE